MRADDDDAGVAGIVGVPPACGGEWRQTTRADDDDAGVAAMKGGANDSRSAVDRIQSR
jgi:hypothetical protein